MLLFSFANILFCINTSFKAIIPIGWFRDPLLFHKNRFHFDEQSRFSIILHLGEPRFLWMSLPGKTDADKKISTLFSVSHISQKTSPVLNNTYTHSFARLLISSIRPIVHVALLSIGNTILPGFVHEGMGILYHSHATRSAGFTRRESYTHLLLICRTSESF